ncbi:DapH/DapD/GlmU-related protein [Prosthecodimorpha staleyi]|uniref:Acetyltransferase n=1 Tax=Prosthecodimorpha staleyi TaxID=2840188 RepID=A0A947D785_9HYPH|nr:DapH/DapD/GlmU-related protein [Prosthecodimorpha staleyi]MBT9292015.1 hypothetical protein [Prosthecodimorpha staleyi]
MAPTIVIYGCGALAAVMRACLAAEGRAVAAFTVEAGYRQSERFDGLPLVDFSDAGERFLPAETDLIIPIGPHGDGSGPNAVRRRLVAEAAARGFRLPGFRASGARIALPAGADDPPGDNRILFDGVSVQPFATLGANAILRHGVQVSHHVAVEADCFVATGAVLGGGCRIGRGSFVGLNATVRDGIAIAPGCVIGAGAVVVADTEPDGIYAGVPARRLSRPAHTVTTP